MSRKLARNPRSQSIARPRDELGQLQEGIVARKERVAALELELFEARADLARLEQEVEARLGPVRARLEELKGRLRHARQRAARRAQWGARADSPDIPEDVVEQFRRAWTRVEDPAKPPPPEPLHESTADELKTLYRSLAKRFHPDLVRDEGEKVWRVEVMAQVNQAYASRDVQRLRSLSEDTADRPSPPSARTREQIIADLRAEVVRLDGGIAGLESELDRLADSPTTQLKLDIQFARRSGRDLLAEMTSQLAEEIRRSELELAALADSPPR